MPKQPICEEEKTGCVPTLPVVSPATVPVAPLHLGDPDTITLTACYRERCVQPQRWKLT